MAQKAVQLLRAARIDGPSPVLASRARKHALVHGVVTYPPMTPMVADEATGEHYAVPFSAVGGAVLPAFPLEVVTDAIREAAVAEERRLIALLQHKEQRQKALRGGGAAAAAAGTAGGLAVGASATLEHGKLRLHKQGPEKSANREWKPLVAVVSFLSARDTLRLAVTSTSAALLLGHCEFCSAVAARCGWLPPAPFRDPHEGEKLWRRTRAVLELQEVTKTTKNARKKNQTWAEHIEERGIEVADRHTELAAEATRAAERTTVRAAAGLATSPSSIASYARVSSFSASGSGSVDSPAETALEETGDVQVHREFPMEWLHALAASRLMSVQLRCVGRVRDSFNLRGGALCAAAGKEAGLSAAIRFGGISCGAHHCLAVACAGVSVAKCLAEVPAKDLRGYSDHCQRVFSWGSNTFPGPGKLGHRNYQDTVFAPRLADVFLRPRERELCALPAIPVQVSAGYTHSIMLMTNGLAFTCGDGEIGQLGYALEEESTCSTEFRPVLLPEGMPSAYTHVVQVAAGSSVCHVVTLRGLVFSFGNGGDGQLGLGDLRNRYKPTMVQDLADAQVRIRFAAAGDGHSVFLTANGRVWVCGAGEEGQLGHGGPLDESHLFGARMRPALLAPIPSFDGQPATIVHAACGFAHTLLVDDRGCTYSFGEGVRGRLGHGDENSCHTPRRITCFDNCAEAPAAIAKLGHTAQIATPSVVEVVRCGAGRFHSVFLASTGMAFTCGLALNLQLGIECSEADRPLCVLKPQLVHALLDPPRGFPYRVVDVACGDEHTAYLTDAGRVLVNGTGKRGCCGRGTNEDSEAPSRVKMDLPWSAVVDWDAMEDSD